VKTTANLTILVVTIAIISGFVFTYNHDYRWVSHVVAGVATLAFTVGTVFYGMVLSGRLKRTPNPRRFILHRKLGITLGFIAIATFSYGLWIMLPQGKHLFETAHGWLGLIIVILALVQIIPSLILRIREPIRGLHRWTGFILAGFVILQITLGIILLPMFARSPPPPRFSLPWLAPVEENWRPDGILGSNEYYASRIVDNGNYEVQYRTDGEYLYVGIKAKTTGWVGIGIETGEGMQNAGIVFGYVSEGEVIVSDEFGVSQVEHLPDSILGGTDDIIEFGGKEEAGFTIIELKFSIFTGDKYDVPLTPGIHSIIWAYGATDRPEKHLAQGRLEIDFEAK